MDTGFAIQITSNLLMLLLHYVNRISWNGRHKSTTRHTQNTPGNTNQITRQKYNNKDNKQLLEKIHSTVAG